MKKHQQKKTGIKPDKATMRRIRQIDLVIGVSSLIVLLPILALVSISIFFFNGRPIIFRQERVGQSCRKFFILKFRTMNSSTEQPVGQAHLENHRITRFGRILRLSHLDELPQLLNVIKGEMSIVGPRPHATEHDSEFKECISRYGIRYEVKPGITGVAQSSGASGPIRSKWMIRRRTKLDEFWVKNYSISLYFFAIFATITTVLRSLKKLFSNNTL